uniref:Uncharacterized protein n=4 Tax=Hominoidea TaxID=314295 RepID=A0A2I3STH3_PANTR
MMRTPRPRQALHFWTAPDFPGHTYPLHALQSTFLLSCSLVVLPLYRSSKDTLERKESASIKFYIHLSGCIMSSPLLLPFRLLL